MKDYHFEKDDSHLEQTIRLDDINEKIKELKKKDAADELGDANAFLDAFESERFDTIEQEEPQQQEEPDEPTLRPDKPLAALPVEKMPLPAEPAPEEFAPESEEDGLNKRTIGFLALLGVFACILGFALTRCGFRPAEEGSVRQESLLLVESILDTDEIVVYDIFADCRKTIRLTEETELLHAETTQASAIGSAAAGDLLFAALAEDGKTVLSVDYQDNAIQKEELSGLTVDTAQKKLIGEKESFSYGTQAIFLYQDEKIQPADIMEMDRLCLKGYENQIWSVEVLEYHGYLLVENGKNIKNGTIQIDDAEAVSLDGLKRLPLSAGKHTILVQGDNIETRKDTIEIQEEKELQYDLSTAQEKMGVILIDANVSDYRLYINGEQMESPAVLPVGEYNLVILKNGYLEWTEQVALTGDTLTVKAELEQEFQYGTLTVTADCDGAQVFINGEASGVAPMQINLPYGSYTVRVEKEGYSVFEQTVQMHTATASLYAEME